MANSCSTLKLKLFLLVPGLATEPNENGNLQPKTVLLYFSVQKVFCGLGIVRSSPEMHQSNKIASSCYGEILPAARSNKKHQQLPWGNISQMPRSNKKPNNCCGEILYPLLTIYYYSISGWKLPRGTAIFFEDTPC